MPADEKKLDVPTTTAAKPDDAKGPKPGDVLGEIDGVPFKVGDKAPADAKKPAELTLDEHHAALTKRHDVILVQPRRVVNGRIFPERRSAPGEVKLVSLKCVVAHRVLHGMSPDEVKTLRAAFDKAHPLKEGQPDDERRATHFERWALRHIDAKLEGVPDALSLTQHVEAHAHDAAVEKHRKAALEALAAPSSPAA